MKKFYVGRDTSGRTLVLNLDNVVAVKVRQAQREDAEEPGDWFLTWETTFDAGKMSKTYHTGPFETEQVATEEILHVIEAYGGYTQQDDVVFSWNR